MARNVSIGEMRTQIHIKRITYTTDSEGTPTESIVDLFRAPVWCKWVWGHGNETFNNERTELTEKATITMHYSSKVAQTDVVTRGNDRYNIVAYNNVEDKNHFLELYVERTVKA